MARPQKEHCLSAYRLRGHRDAICTALAAAARATPAGLAASRRGAAALRAKRTAAIVAAKSRPCMDCGTSYPPIVMDFDHRPGETKLYNIGNRSGAIPLSALTTEIAKCDVVCANCHRLRTEARRAIH